MIHSKVFECFQEHLPAFAEKVETYFPITEKKLGGLKLSTSFLQE